MQIVKQLAKKFLWIQKKISQPPAGGWPWDSEWLWDKDDDDDEKKGLGIFSKKPAGGKSSETNILKLF